MQEAGVCVCVCGVCVWGGGGWCRKIRNLIGQKQGIGLQGAISLLKKIKRGGVGGGGGLGGGRLFGTE